MEIVVSVPEDKEEVLALVEEIKKDMVSHGNDQWNDIYPKQKLFIDDLKTGTMYAMKDDGKMVGIIVLSEYQDNEYEDMEWEDKDGRIMVVHRFGVHPEWQRKGVAGKLMEFAEELARKEGYTSIRLDTYSRNYRSIGFFKKRGYTRRPGAIHFPECPDEYYCYEIPITKK